MENDPSKNTPITFTDEQQAFINGIIDQRLGKTKTAHAAELKTATDRVAALEAELAAAKEAAAKGGEGSPDAKALEAQYKSLIDAEKQNTQRAIDLARKNEGEAKATAKENRRILKGQAILAAASAQDSFEFVDLDLVRQLVDNEIHYDDESKTFVVKKDGVVLQNNSLQPMTVKEYLAQFAAQRPYLVKGITKGGAGSTESTRGGGAGLGKVTSKLDLKTTKDKSDYITKFGYQAFADLPAK